MIRKLNSKFILWLRLKEMYFMVCVNHGTNNGVNTCSKCGNWLCEDCSIDIDGRVVCKKCVAELLGSNSGKRTAEPVTVEKHVHHYEHHTHHTATGGKRRISRLLLLMFSCMPGINYMFMGLMKRGVYALGAFMLAGYCAGTLESPLIGIVAGMIYVVSFFDGFHVRRKLINGEYVEDGFSGITNAILRHKLPLGIVTLLLVCSGVFSKIARPFYRSYVYGYSMSHSGMEDLFSVAFVLLVVAAVFYFFIRPMHKSKKKSDDSHSDIIDKTDRMQ